MPKSKPEAEYVSNNSFMTAQVKIPKPFGNDYEDPLEALRFEKEQDKSSNLNLGIATPTTPTTPVPTTPTKNLEPTSPTKDFQKVNNSITRKAIPSGIFGSGKAKQLYDALYSMTRGAIRPIRVVRITKPRLMKLAGIGTRQTLWLNLEHLENVGLVRKNVLLGEHGGNEYEVFVPEELSDFNSTPTTPTTPTSPTSPSNRVYQVQNLAGVVGADSAPTTPSLNAIIATTSDDANTSFKDYSKDDDTRVNEAFAAMTKRLDLATKKLTGKGVSRNEAEKWAILADLLILELEVAASRAGEVSSVPAFLTEVLHRRLLAGREKPEKMKAPKAAAKKDTVGKPTDEAYEVRPLSATEREAALAQLREFAEDDFLADFEKWYTPEDWTWLMENLKSVR